MDFGGGFAVGIGAGMGSGIATGIASGTSAGRKQATEQLRSYIEENGIEMHDRYGKPIKLDDFMDQAISCAPDCCGRKKLWVFVVLGGVLAIAVAAFFVMKSVGSF